MLVVAEDGLNLEGAFVGEALGVIPTITSASYVLVDEFAGEESSGHKIWLFSQAAEAEGVLCKRYVHDRLQHFAASKFAVIVVG